MNIVAGRVEVGVLRVRSFEDEAEVTRNKMGLSQNGSSKGKSSFSFCGKRGTWSVIFGFFAYFLTITCWNSVSFACIASEEDEASLVNAFKPTIDELKVGICGVYKNGFQTQAIVSWTSDEFDLTTVELETIDSDGTPFVVKHVVSSDELKLSRIEARIILPKANGKLTVRLLSGDEIVAEQVYAPGKQKVAAPFKIGETSVTFFAPTSSTKPVYLTVGSENLGFTEAFAEMRWKEEERPTVVSTQSFQELPTDPRSYEIVDKLFISTSRPEIFDSLNVHSLQIQAIEQWVKSGGSVVLLADEHAIPLLSGEGALSNLSPGTKVAEYAQEFRNVNSLTNELQNVKNLAMTGSKTHPYLRTPVISELKSGSQVEMLEVETPLLVARPVGLGSIVYFAGDLSAAPLVNWSGRGRLMLKIIGIDPDKNVVKQTGASFVKRGYSDLSGQLRSALDKFDGVKTVSFGVIAFFIFAYLLAIAPLDWLLVKKLIKKPNVTWISFPCLALVFCFLAVWIFKSTTSNVPLVNQVDLLDVDVESGIVRDSSWLGFYSPTSERYDLKLTRGSLVNSNEEPVGVEKNDFFIGLTPLPLAGDSLGGSDQKSYMTRFWTKSYSLNAKENAFELSNVPLTTRSSKSFFGRWISTLSGLPSSPDLRDDGLALHGSVVNPFNVPIYSAYIIFQGGAYSLGTLVPGETKIERSLTRLEPMRVLNEHQSSVPTDQLRNWISTTYNASSTRVPYILRTASFFEFGGGSDNFGLSQRLQRDVDLSELLRCGRAVVLGTIVDSEYELYQQAGNLDRKSTDVLEIDRLRKELAEQKGEVLEENVDKATERYGLVGTSDEFMPSKFDWKRSSSNEEWTLANKRTVVVRLIVPLMRGGIR